MRSYSSDGMKRSNIHPTDGYLSLGGRKVEYLLEDGGCWERVFSRSGVGRYLAGMNVAIKYQDKCVIGGAGVIHCYYGLGPAFKKKTPILSLNQAEVWRFPSDGASKCPRRTIQSPDPAKMGLRPITSGRNLR